MHALTEPFDSYALTVCKHGGNQKWLEFIGQYKFTVRESHPKILYKSDAAMHHRKRLRAQVYNLPFDKKEPSLTATESIDRAFKSTMNVMEALAKPATDAFNKKAAKLSEKAQLNAAKKQAEQENCEEMPRLDRA